MSTPRRRRSKGEGSTYQRTGRSGYYADLSLDGRRLHFHAATKEECDQWRQEMRYRHQRGWRASGRIPTVDEYLHEWLEGMNEQLSYNSRASYGQAVQRLCGALGSIKLDRLTPADIRRAYEDFAGAISQFGVPLSAATRNKYHRVLREALKGAVDDGIIMRNPADSVRAPRIRSREQEHLTQAELQRLLAEVEGRPQYALYMLLGRMGPRIGEALGLLWTDLDFATGRLDIVRQLQYHLHEGFVFVDLKTAHSRRTLVLPGELIRTLRRHQTLQAERELRSSAWDGRLPLIFTTRNGRPCHQQATRERFARDLAGAGVKEIRLHDLRHTAASIMLHDLRLPVTLVSRILGHADTGITLRVYGHLMPGQAEEAARLMDEAWGG